MNLIERCQQQAKANPSWIVFPDAVDIRAIQAAIYIQQQQLGYPWLLANPADLRNLCEQHDLPFNQLNIIDPATSEWLPEFTAYLAQRMPDKPIEDLKKNIKDPLWFGAAMIATGKSDYCIAGNLSSTSSVLRAGLRVLGLAPNNKTLSSIMIMISPEGDQILGFADCGVVPQPTGAQLADIAISTAQSFEAITEQTARVAMLSFSTKGSAKHEAVSNVQLATDIVRERMPNLAVDGELQFDAAMVDSVAKQKAPDSQVAGKANVLIFPSLEAGNIGYKIAQRLGKYEAIGPLIQGLNGSMHDLSRGCSWQDMVQVAMLATKMRVK
ncbi:phosphate acetyltransferase [Entomomonas asaccharolytica]|uniref:phosphate acetyltransferase n=1 Tax=Entomomonas asaccharolytica TaxID=2785331 RepID=A0A974RY25_9GAMM|nr:phosphate acetyltransferase [Entomomonas asaccharolytica]QQP86737.1 phosphate acetyltransferase [Entomomonas asaccharolytica]